MLVRYTTTYPTDAFMIHTYLDLLILIVRWNNTVTRCPTVISAAPTFEMNKITIDLTVGIFGYINHDSVPQELSILGFNKHIFVFHERLSCARKAKDEIY